MNYFKIAVYRDGADVHFMTSVEDHFLNVTEARELAAEITRIANLIDGVSQDDTGIPGWSPTPAPDSPPQLGAPMKSAEYYIATLTAELAKARAVSDATAAKLKDARETVTPMIMAQIARAYPGAPITSRWSGQFSVAIAPGLELSVNPSSLDGGHKIGAGIKAMRKVETENKEACRAHCAIRDDMAHKKVRAYSSFISSVYGRNPTPEQLAKGLADFRAVNGQHTCAI